MTNHSVIENKISAVRKYVKMASHYKKYKIGEIEADDTIRGAVERYLYLAAQAVIDLAEAVISLRRYRKPSTMAESFEILAEEGVIPPGLAGKMARLTGFRNVLAHDYEKINYGIVYGVLESGLADIEEFLAEIQAKTGLN